MGTAVRSPCRSEVPERADRRPPSDPYGADPSSRPSRAPADPSLPTRLREMVQCTRPHARTAAAAQVRTGPRFRSDGESARGRRDPALGRPRCGGTARASGSVRPFILNDPLVYLSTGRPRDDEASCIDLALPIGRPVEEPRGSLGYYPQYASISPDQRANYLRWLAGGRTAPLDDIGYAFLYFYGLERRLLVEQQDLSPIVKEVVRLLETYTFSGSFDGYLSRFLSYTLARAGIGTLKDKWFEAVFDKTRASATSSICSSDWHGSSVGGCPSPRTGPCGSRGSTRGRRVASSSTGSPTGSGSCSRSDTVSGSGMGCRSRSPSATVKSPTDPPARHCWISRGPPSAIKPVRIPHVMGIQSQFKPLIEIWTGCIEDLKPLSRAMARGAEVLTREAYEALPDDLKPGVEHPDKPDWDRIAAENAREDGAVLVAVGHLATIHGLPQRAKLTSRQSESIARTAHHVGLEIEPDARVTNRPTAGMRSWRSCDPRSRRGSRGIPGMPERR